MGPAVQYKPSCPTLCRFAGRVRSMVHAQVLTALLAAPRPARVHNRTPIHMATLLLALPAFPLDAGGPPCALADARAQAACEINHRPGKRERHLARMAKCDFKTEPRIQLLLLAEGDPDHMRLIDNTTIRAQACEVREGNGVWHFTRVGPFSTRGGYSWTGVTTVHDESMHAQWRVSHEGRASLFVGDHVLGSADASGDLLGYPPIHQHHWHYFHASDLGRDFLSVHGDQDCPGRDGAYCTLVEYPNGSAFELVPQLGIVAEFNDVRPSGAPPLDWYAFGGLFIHDPAIPKPRGMHWANLASGNFNAPPGHRGTVLFDTARDHVTWATGTLPSVDYVVDSYFHAHPDMVDDIWVIGAPASRLGLLSPPWIAAHHHLKRGPTVIRDLKAHLERAMAAAAVPILCRYNGVPHLERVRGYENAFARRAACPFSATGDIEWTYVGFYRAQVDGLPREYPMHSMLRVAYHALEGAPNDIDARCAKPTPFFDRLTAGPASALALLADDVDSVETFFDGMEADCINAFLYGVGYEWFFGADVRYVWSLYAFWAALPWVPLVLVGGWCVCRAPRLRSLTKKLSVALRGDEAAFDMLPLRGGKQ